MRKLIKYSRFFVGLLIFFGAPTLAKAQSNQIIDIGHNRYLPEEHYLQFNNQYFQYLDPVAKIHHINNSDADLFLLDTAYINSVDVNPQRQIYAYSADGYRLSTLLQISQSGNWVNISKETCTYDVFGNQLTSTWENWESGVWLNVSKVTSTYGTNNTLLTWLLQSWENDAWVNLNRATNTYNSFGNLIFNIQEVWYLDAWKNYSTELYTYDDQEKLILATSQLWNETYWFNDKQFNYTYDSNGNLSSSITEIWEDATWKNFSKVSYNFNSSNVLNSQITEMWENSSWAYLNKNSYTYNALDLIETSTFETWNVDTWVYSQRNNYAYGTFGNLESLIIENWINGSWANLNLSQNYYDENGNAIEGDFYIWDGVTWLQNQDGLVTMSFNLASDSYSYTGYNVEAHYYSISVGVINLGENAIQNFSIHPNPALQFTTLSFNNLIKCKVDISVYDSNGKEIESIYKGIIEKGNNEFRINTSKLPSGTYIIGLLNDNITISQKLIITK
ncbi:MAG: T9SS type A sorting domain-containing protein [Bacteroidetes bacterium]|nr:T9SS type A sorting domain-containing protein [Bacteroidota bacterium]